MLKKIIKSKSMLMLLLIIMMIAITGTSMAANYSCKISLQSDKTQIKKGESITILVKATDINAGEGIVAFNAMLEYNSDIFDCKVEGSDDGEWSKTSLLENSLSMCRSDLVENSKDQVIAKIVLTAKTNAPIGKQILKLTSIDFTGGEQTFSVDDVTGTITIVDETGSESGNGSGSGSNNGTGSESGNESGSGSNNGADSESGNGNNSGSDNEKRDPETNKGSSSNSKTDSNKVNPSPIKNASGASSLPKTGITNIVLIISTIIGIMVASICYIRYKRAY